MGHTGPVTCVQFDEYHLVSGSLDKSIRVRLLFNPRLPTTAASLFCLAKRSDFLFTSLDLGSQNWFNVRYDSI